MALTNRERQARWRQKHPEKAAARFARFKESKRRKRPGCQHPNQKGIEGEIEVRYCPDCGFVGVVTEDLARYCAENGIPYRSSER